MTPSKKRGKRKTSIKKRAEKKDTCQTVILEGIKEAKINEKVANITQKGLSLSVKFALVISIVSAFLCIMVGLFIYFNVKRSLLEEIDRKGRALVKSLYIVGKEYFFQYINFYKSYKLAKETNNKELLKDIQTKLENLRKRFENYLKEVISREEKKYLLNITIVISYIKERKFLQIGQYEAKELSGNTRRLDNNIKVIEGNIVTEENDEIGVKVYYISKSDIFPKLTKQREYNSLDIYVMLSSQHIINSTNKILINTAIFTIIAIIIGIIISILLANHVTEPVRRLIKDISIVASGKLEHKTTPMSNDEIGVLAHAFNIMTKNLRNAHKAELEKQAQEHELEIAKEIQLNLLPSSLPEVEGYDIYAFYRPSKEVGGDYYDFIEIGDEHLGVVIADVSGKGIPGSMVMSMTRTLVRIEATRNISPSKTFLEVNKMLAKDIRRGMFVTAMYGVLIIPTGEFIVTSAGHNPAILWRYSDSSIELINPKGMALGLDKGGIFERTLKEGRYKLESGDRLVFYTDGVTEAMNPKNEEFGEDRFIDLIKSEGYKTSEDFVKRIVEELERWKGKGPQSDDITIITIKRL